MKAILKLSLFLPIIFFMSIYGCTRKKSEIVWDINLPRIGSQSSIRAVDLNKDNVLDIVIGAGENEYTYSKQGILAFNGRNGEILWQQEADDQVFGSATFYDITGDAIPDVFIGGRSCALKALDGKTGDTIWTYHYEQFIGHPILQFARYNFYCSVLVPDQNDDGYQDLLVQNGGNVTIGPNIEEGRVPGVLMIVDSRTGDIIAADTMPDGKESYMSPICFLQTGETEHNIVFGSGGETILGHLYLAKLSDLLETNLSNAKIIASEEGHGFIAPPVLADINLDGYFDIIAISHASTAFAIDGKDQSILWQKQISNTESSNSFAVAYFTDDDIPDFFTYVSKGEWPNNTGLLQILFDGSNGQIAYQDSIGCTGFSSPVAYDLNKDGQSEVIISVNEFDCSTGFSGDIQNIENRLIAIDFTTGTHYPIDQQDGFKNIFTTPWIGDLDKDGYLDIVHAQYYHATSYITAFLGMQIKRISTNIEMNEKQIWGAYMGSCGDGFFNPIL